MWLEPHGLRSTSILAAVLMAVVYRSGGEEEKEYNEITMANIMPESFRWDSFNMRFGTEDAIWKFLVGFVRAEDF